MQTHLVSSTYSVGLNFVRQVSSGAVAWARVGIERSWDQIPVHARHHFSVLLRAHVQFSFVSVLSFFRFSYIPLVQLKFCRSSPLSRAEAVVHWRGVSGLIRGIQGSNPRRRKRLLFALFSLLELPFFSFCCVLAGLGPFDFSRRGRCWLAGHPALAGPLRPR